MKIDWQALIASDQHLGPFSEALKWRAIRLEEKLAELKSWGGLEQFSLGHKYLGLNPGEVAGEKGVWYREWAPQALSLSLVGDFNGWCGFTHPMKRKADGIWEIFIPESEVRIKHGSLVKVLVAGRRSKRMRIPAYIRKVQMDEQGLSSGVYWNPPKKFKWKEARTSRPQNLKIYEAHVGIASEEEKIASFAEFANQVLPRIVRLGYNAVQLMAIAEHPYYGSFGYQVSNFFAISRFFGDPEDFKKLVDQAHGMGLMVLIDLVHSHAVENINEGLNDFDGSGHQYFHEGERGNHPVWGTKLFDYGKKEVLRFLLSNVRYFLDEFRVDGFRFDGVTSMIYHDRGLGSGFGDYRRYFDPKSVDDEAILYLQLANLLVHQINPEVVTIAEDVSGMPGMAWPVEKGGIGFDYRLAMGMPDYWIKTLKHKRDEDWSMKEMFAELTNRRLSETHIGYVESHDQALVGDKTVAFWLMDKEMYWNMEKRRHNLVIDRGIALHKLIRLVSFSLGGEGWLNFMGNEFGHPEWIDFPREGNNFSYFYARRQWSLVDNPDLRYSQLNEFERAMQALDEQFGILVAKCPDLIAVDEKRKVLVFSRGELVFVFNFHPENSYEGLPVRVVKPVYHQVVFSSDAKSFGGFGRIKVRQRLPVWRAKARNSRSKVKVYSPSRTAQVLAPIG